MFIQQATRKKEFQNHQDLKAIIPPIEIPGKI
jgi:hypothetical protein